MPVRLTHGNPIDDAWATLHMTYQSVWKYGEELSSEPILTQQQYTLLRAVKDMPGIVTPSTIADWLDRNPNSVTLTLNRMERNGLVRRIRDVGDRRVVRLTITPEGEKRLEQAAKPAFKLSREVLSALTEEELLTFLGLLQKIREKTFELRNIQDKVINVNINRRDPQ